MDTFKLSDAERKVYEEIEKSLLSLPTASQYNVLRNVAHAMNRKVVRAGAAEFRGAMIASNQMVRPQVTPKPTKTSKKSLKGKAGKDPYYESEEGKALLSRREELKGQLQTASGSAASSLKEEITALSKSLREGSRLFRAQGTDKAGPQVSPEKDA